MRNLIRNKKTIYVCRQVVENDRIVYEKPIKAKVTIQPISDGVMLFGGNEFVNELTIYTNPIEAKKFHNNDRCYYEKKPPLKHNKLCLDADFYVHGEPLTYLNDTKIYIKRMTGTEDG